MLMVARSRPKTARRLTVERALFDIYSTRVRSIRNDKLIKGARRTGLKVKVKLKPQPSSVKLKRQGSTPRRVQDLDDHTPQFQLPHATADTLHTNKIHHTPLAETQTDATRRHVLPRTTD